MGKTLYSTGPFGERYRILVSDALLQDVVTVQEVLQGFEECRQIVDRVVDVGLDGELVAFGVGGERGYSDYSKFIEPTISFGPVYSLSVEDGAASGVDEVAAKVADGGWEQTVYYYRSPLDDEAYAVVNSDSGLPADVNGPALYIREEFIVVLLEWIEGLEQLSASPSNLGLGEDSGYACLTDHPDTWFSRLFQQKAADDEIAADDQAAWQAVQEK